MAEKMGGPLTLDPDREDMKHRGAGLVNWTVTMWVALVAGLFT